MGPEFLLTIPPWVLRATASAEALQLGFQGFPSAALILELTCRGFPVQMAQQGNAGAVAEEQLSMSSQEERELRRVFDTLCDYHKKSVLRAKARPAAKPAQEEHECEGNNIWLLVAAKASESDCTMRLMPGEAEELSSEAEHALEELRVRVRRRAMKLRGAVDKQALERNPDRKIKAIDLAHAMKALGKPRPRKEIKNIVWEVDENLDGMVDWDEFQLMYLRNINDKTGLEPSGLYNLAQFMIYDQLAMCLTSGIPKKNQRTRTEPKRTVQCGRDDESLVCAIRQEPDGGQGTKHTSKEDREGGALVHAVSILSPDLNS
eukprot:scaffold845_cov231-Pinguiococcus_pyrenoidosus.AAC.8